MIGAFLILIDQTPDDSGLVPLIANRAVSGLILTLAVGVLWLRARKRTPGARPDPITLLLAIACGVVDAVANTGLLLGLRLGDLTVMSVLTALYPAGTIILAAIVLKERIAPVQVIGLVLALAAAAMLALA
ncbi:EamA family transporter [Glaciihabitans arcticus]|uniref:EamA family transporter n=1 Tax=Glaciihabitans arcticus TaxID=2668039 RepID=UPI001F00282D|nr:EamA family transporter [Glaciihabitans arcticus]